jgi:hypothetical protein
MEGSEHEAAVLVARNQSLFRGVNDRISEVNESFRIVDVDDAEFVCECADDRCMERIALTLDQYRAVRLVPTHFVVKGGHVYPKFERVVEEHDGHVIVEKFGVAGQEAVSFARNSGKPS